MDIKLNQLDRTPSEFPCPQRQVMAFMRHIPSQEKAVFPQMPGLKTVKLRVDLIHEETLELIEASGLKWEWVRSLKTDESAQKVYERFSDPADSAYEYRKLLVVDQDKADADGRPLVDMVAVGDALTDILYVTFGAGCAYGIYLPELFQAVQANNMKKVEFGTIDPVSGKLIKPAGHQPPDLQFVFNEQIHRSVHGPAGPEDVATYPWLG